MTTSYKVVFTLSILMIFVVIIGGAISGAKSVGFGVWYWGYTAWKMYKRDNASLVMLQKVMLWFQAVAFSVALGVLLFSDSDVRRYVDVTPLGLIVLGSISILITYSLFVFFTKQSSSDFVSGFSNRNQASSIDDKYWAEASSELSLNRNEAAWAKSFAMSDGDEAKAKGMYIKNRAFDLMKADVVVAPTVSPQSKKSESYFFSKIYRFMNSFGSFGKIAVLGVLALIAYNFIADDENQGVSNLAKSPASISLDRSSSWAYNVSELRRGIRDGTFPVRIVGAEVIANEFDIFDKPWYRYRETLPSNLVSTVEEKNIWWSADGKFFIRLYNPSGANLLGFNFSITDSNCATGSSNKILIHFDLKDVPLLPYYYGIYATSWPFDYSETIGSGTKCGTVTTVLTQK